MKGCVRVPFKFWSDFIKFLEPTSVNSTAACILWDPQEISVGLTEWSHPQNAHHLQGTHKEAVQVPCKTSTCGNHRLNKSPSPVGGRGAKHATSHQEGVREGLVCKSLYLSWAPEEEQALFLNFFPFPFEISLLRVNSHPLRCNICFPLPFFWCKLGFAALYIRLHLSVWRGLKSSNKEHLGRFSEQDMCIIVLKQTYITWCYSSLYAEMSEISKITTNTENSADISALNVSKRGRFWMAVQAAKLYKSGCG
jgi:hypothetical protein